MSDKKSKKVEWNDLNEEGRNCLLWPDFLEWGAEKEVVLEKKSKDDDLGITAIVEECSETGTCFNIIKQIIEGTPATECVEQFDWITAVDENPTTRVKESEDLVKLTKNGKCSVHLSIRRAIDPLVNIKVWGKEKAMTLEIDSKKLGFRLAHFYSKVKSEIIDHILIFEVKSGKDGKSKIHKQLNRGDELLSIDGQDLKGKKLNDIHSLFFKSPKVDIHVKRIVPREEYYQEVLRTIALKYPDQIYWRQEKKKVVFEASLDTPLGLMFNSSPKSNSEKEFFHIVSQVIDGTPASQENVCVGSRLLSVNDRNITCLKKDEAAKLMRNTRDEFRFVMAAPEGIKQQPSRKKRHSLIRKNSGHAGNASVASSSSSSTMTTMNCSSNAEDGCKSDLIGCEVSSPKSSLLAGTNENKGATAKATSPKKKLGKSVSMIIEQNNNAYESSDSNEDSNKHSDDNLCKKCEKEVKEKTCKILPNDKKTWSINNIDPVSLDRIYRNLDKEVQGTDINKRYFSGHLELSCEEIESIIQKHSSHGGSGAAKDFLQIWRERDTARNVGKLLEILKRIKRKTAVELIDEWIVKDTCHGCGALIERATQSLKST